MASSVPISFSKKSIVFITGASKGIGQTIAIELSKIINKNSVFVLLARSVKGLEETKTSIQQVDNSFTVLTFTVDLSEPSLTDYEQLFGKVLSSIEATELQYGYIIHNAGHVGELKEAASLSDLNTWRKYFDLNLFSTVLLNNVFLQKIQPIAAQLVIVNITSLCGRQPFLNMAMYCSGKAARELFFKVLAVDQPNVTVLNYSPGPVLTDMFNSICDTAENPQVRNNFQEMRDGKVLTTLQTVGMLLNILEKGDFKSGDTIDYFDRV